MDDFRMQWLAHIKSCFDQYCFVLLGVTRLEIYVKCIIYEDPVTINKILVSKRIGREFCRQLRSVDSENRWLMRIARRQMDGGSTAQRVQGEVV